MIKPYYEDSFVTIYHGDCAQVAPYLPDYDLLLTDPPYGINENSKKRASRGLKAKPIDYGHFDWDKMLPAKWLVEMLRAKASRAAIFGGNYFHLPPSSCWLVWDKEINGDFADAELVWTNLSKAVRLKRYRWNGMLQEHAGENKEQRFHPSQKPLLLIKWIIGLCLPVTDMFDPFMGSGSTLRAAKDLNIKATGIEKDERYCEIAAKRMAQEVFNFNGLNARVIKRGEKN